LINFEQKIKPPVAFIIELESVTMKEEGQGISDINVLPSFKFQFCLRLHNSIIKINKLNMF
jgi:hypothetical protein